MSKDELVKGYEIQKDEFVEVTDEDFAKAALKKDRVIDIMDFVDANQIDDRYFDRPYYLTPAQGGAKAGTRCCARPSAAPGGSAWRNS